MTPPVRVKICGLCRPQDVTAAAAAGADALGLVFVAASARRVTPDQAARLMQVVPPFVERVGLFMDADADAVRTVLAAVPLSLLQFHGSEDGAYCGQFGLRYVKAVSAQDMSVAEAEAAFPDAAGILVDSHRPGGMGGTGRTADWNRLAAGRLPLVLAGGLTPDNVARAVRTVRPWAVDVSSGVESAPGVKDAAAIRRFIEQAKQGE